MDDKKQRKPHDHGKLVWWRDNGVGLLPIEGQPDHADQPAARRWLMRELEGEALPADAGYALHRVATTVRPRVQVTRKAVL